MERNQVALVANNVYSGAEIAQPIQQQHVIHRSSYIIYVSTLTCLAICAFYIAFFSLEMRDTMI